MLVDPGLGPFFLFLLWFLGAGKLENERGGPRRPEQGGFAMAAKAWSTQQKPVEEIFFQNDAVSLCLLIHRRSKTMRVIDFRAGPSNAKRMFVLSLAQREGVEKVYTLVERDEVATWVKLGFAKEGNIPGFYKRSDAFIRIAPGSADHRRADGARRRCHGAA